MPADPGKGKDLFEDRHVSHIPESERHGTMRTCNTEARLPVATPDENFLAGKLSLEVS